MTLFTTTDANHQPSSPSQLLDDWQKLPRIFADEPVNESSLPVEITITHQATVHHCRSVLRMKTGQGLVVVDSDNEQAYLARLEGLNRQQLNVSLLQALPKQQDSLPVLTIGASLIKSQRWDWMLQKLTELGVRHVMPIESKRSVVPLGSSANKQARWQQVLRSAAEQSEGLFIPDISLPGKLYAFIEATKEADVKVVLAARNFESTGKREPLRLVYRKSVALRTMAVAVGPEGGWTEDEIQYLMSHGFQLASFGQRVLRSETAAIAMISALIYECGD